MRKVSEAGVQKEASWLSPLSTGPQSQAGDGEGDKTNPTRAPICQVSSLSMLGPHWA